MGLTEAIKHWCEAVISASGYTGIFFLTLVGCCNIPIPSEAVSLFSGFLAQQDKLSLHFAALIGTAGCVAGSALSYWLGMKLGEEGLIKYGKYVLMRTKEIEHGRTWFERHGLLFTLWGRFIPVVRSVVSFPAGIYRASFGRFLLYAFLGSLPWCYLWTVIGFSLGAQWPTIEKYTKVLDVLAILLIVAVIGRFIWKRTHTAAEIVG